MPLYPLPYTLPSRNKYVGLLVVGRLVVVVPWLLLVVVACSCAVVPAPMLTPQSELARGSVGRSSVVVSGGGGGGVWGMSNCSRLAKWNGSAVVPKRELFSSIESNQTSSPSVIWVLKMPQWLLEAVVPRARCL